MKIGVNDEYTLSRAGTGEVGVIKETFRRIVKLSATLSLFFVKCF